MAQTYPAAIEHACKTGPRTFRRPEAGRRRCQLALHGAYFYRRVASERSGLSRSHERNSFDAPYDYVTSALSSTRDFARKLAALWNGHQDKVASGEIAKIDGRGNIHVQESIDKDLRSEIETFLNAATRCLKTGMQNILRALDANIGFLFQQKETFEKSIGALKCTDPDLAVYLQQTRVWSEPMLKSRIDLEHGTWVLPGTGYAAENGEVKANEPTVAGKPVAEFVDYTLDRLCCFVEELSSHLFAPQNARRCHTY